ncbi:HNH endonuclease [Sphingobium aquiterrae]|uniref:HNH endonuclease n=1 Tax=Sphingobium aquiterrae TaxID=2038656 RepID=UPI0030161FA4
MIDESDEPAPLELCALCGRPLGEQVEWHHLVPKNRGGKEKVALHPICHKTIHATLSNAEIARKFNTIAALRAQEGIARFIAWVERKPPDFYAPTQRQGR